MITTDPFLPGRHPIEFLNWAPTILQAQYPIYNCVMCLMENMYPVDLPGIEELGDQPQVMCRGGSVIIGLFGDVIAAPLYGELAPAEIPREKFDFDVVGHYARPDVFHFRVNESPGGPFPPFKDTT